MSVQMEGHGHAALGSEGYQRWGSFMNRKSPGFQRES